MLPVTALQQVVVIPDDAFTPYTVPNNPRRHKYFELYPDREYVAQLIIAPHHHEAWLNVHLFKLALFCRAHAIKLVSIGHENQLPFFGMFSDAVILQEGPLDDMFGWFSAFSTDITGFNMLSGWADIYKHDETSWDDLPTVMLSGEIQKAAKSAWRAIYAHYKAEHVIGVFSDCNIFVTQSARNAFSGLDAAGELPRNALWCEIKARFGKANSRLKNLNVAGVPLVGLNKNMQKELVRAHGSAFMTVQLLSSLYNDCRMVLGAGSSHVFAVAPANIAMALAPADRFYTAETEHIVRKFNLHRYGTVPYVEEATLTWMCTEDARQYSPAADDEQIAHWQLDYFLTEPAMRAYLDCAMAIPPRKNVVELSWAEYKTQRELFAVTTKNRFRFQRDGGQHLCDLTLNPDGTLTPKSDNETYWNLVGTQLALKTHLGQASTVLRPTQQRGKLSGPFIYNQTITHELEQI